MAQTSTEVELAIEKLTVKPARKLSKFISGLRRMGWGYLAALVILVGLAMLFLFPLYWMFTGSFKAQIVTIQTPPELFLPTLPSKTGTDCLRLNSRCCAGLPTA